MHLAGEPPGPPSRNSFGSVDISASGLLAFPSGSSISVVDSRSFQHISTIPLPAPSFPSSSPSAALSPFVTVVRWTPLPLSRDLLVTEPSSSHPILAVGDRHGRIALVDCRHKSVLLWLDSDSSSKCGIQDLCWILFRPDAYILAAISGPSSLSLYNTSTGHCFFKYDATPEILSCIRSDPFDSERCCVIGLRGVLLSISVVGEAESEVVVKELRIPTDCTEFLKPERDDAGARSSSSSAPAVAAFPLHSVKLTFSPQCRHILFVTFPRELVVFDLQNETALSSSSLPRGCSKFLDVLTDPNSEFLYCAHLDGKLSIWRRKEGEQVHICCVMGELMPSIGTSVPSPSLLAVAICQSDSTLQNVAKLYRAAPNTPQTKDFDNPIDFNDEALLLSKTQMVSISDDGKVCNWLLTAEEIEKDVEAIPYIEEDSDAIASTDGINLERKKQKENLSSNKGRPPSVASEKNTTFKLCLVGQLQLLSSTLTMLAVPSPSLTATLARGGNYPAVAVPLVALGTQSGMIDIVDVSANAVAASSSVHTSADRGNVLSAIASKQTHRGTGGSSVSSVISFLHIDLIREIMLRCDLGSLFRSKAVCKYWSSCVQKDPEFKRKFIERKMIEDSSGKKDGSLTYRQCSHWEMLLVNPSRGLPRGSSLLDFLPFFNGMNPAERRQIVLGSSNGLLLCSSSNLRNAVFMVCNPFTRQHVELPRSLKWPYDDSKIGFICEPLYHFGDDGSVTINNHFRFKVVRLWWSKHENRIKLAVYSSDTGEWQRLSIPRPEDYELDMEPGNAIVYRGNLCWLLEPCSLYTLNNVRNQFKAYDVPVESVYNPETGSTLPFEGLSVCQGALWIGQVCSEKLQVFCLAKKKWTIRYTVHLQGHVVCESPSARNALLTAPGVLNFRCMHPHDARISFLTLKEFLLRCNLETGVFTVIAENPKDVNWSNVVLFDLLHWPVPKPKLGPSMDK